MTPKDDGHLPPQPKQTTSPAPANTDTNDGVGELKTWYKLLKDDYPVVALSVALLGIGLLMLIVSASMQPAIAGGVALTGNALLGLGVLGAFLGLIKAVFGSNKAK